MKERTQIARRLRRHATEAERILWPAVRESYPGKRFRRQHPIGRYVVDFACPAHKIAIEIDGGQHAMREPADLARTGEIARRGYRVLRFWNNVVTQNLPGVLQIIQQNMAGQSTLSALQGGEGGARADGVGG